MGQATSASSIHTQRGLSVGNTCPGGYWVPIAAISGVGMLHTFSVAWPTLAPYLSSSLCIVTLAMVVREGSSVLEASLGATVVATKASVERWGCHFWNTESKMARIGLQGGTARQELFLLYAASSFLHVERWGWWHRAGQRETSRGR